MSAQGAEILGLQALAWLAADPTLLERFTNGCGIDESPLRAAAGDSATLAAVLDFLAGDEALLLGFCGEGGHDPAMVGEARRLLDREVG